jgi:acetyl-CoA carboxylase, biotin carboxylase subunit
MPVRLEYAARLFEADGGGSEVFDKLLIANRGEIACRVARAARELGVRTVAVYSDADEGALHVEQCDESVRLGPAPPRESYLNAEKVIDAAKRSGAEAIHPGYGFLSEQADFAQACAAAGLVFVGPPPGAMRAIKDKAQARSVMRAAGVPVVPGSEGHVTPEVAVDEARALGFPLLVKAAGGGGGIGMQVANDEAELAKAVRACSDRARASFGRDAVYLERYFPAPRHVEVQVFGDGRLTLHLGARECSIQRRHQKIVEEAPAPAFELPRRRPAVLAALLQAGLTAARTVGYANAGTCEFLLVGDEVFFIELNARLQVEHPVTEAVTGMDLVQLQIRTAAGEHLPFGQEDVKTRGHAIECRINAEDPVKFFPSPGRIARFETPVPPDGRFHGGVRIDAGYRAGDTVTPFYDSLLAKLVVHAGSRDEAIGRLRGALEGFIVEGVKTNLPLHRRIAGSLAFAAGQLDTRFLERLS